MSRVDSLSGGYSNRRKGYLVGETRQGWGDKTQFHILAWFQSKSGHQMVAKHWENLVMLSRLCA